MQLLQHAGGWCWAEQTVGVVIIRHIVTVGSFPLGCVTLLHLRTCVSIMLEC